MKKIFILFALILNILAFAQDDKTVTLVASGQGKTQDEAKQAALRNAIEQAFGTFISSKTEIVNDNLLKDEIISVSNGNIQRFEVISELKIPDGGYTTNLKATVSVTKLTSFAESKGVDIEFKGSLFAFNVKQQILNEQNEVKAIEDMCAVVKKLSDASFDYSIKVSDPIAINGTNDKWQIPMYVSVSANNNLFILANYINKTLKGISLTVEEGNNYVKLGKGIFPVCFAANANEYGYYILRKKESYRLLMKQVYYFNHSLQNFKISNGLSVLKNLDEPNKLDYIYDAGFRIFLDKYYEVFKEDSVFGPLTHQNTRKSLIPPIAGNVGYKEYILYGTEDFNLEIPINREEYGDIYLLDVKKFVETQAQYPSYDLFKDQFSFVIKLRNQLINKPSVVISFIGILPKNEIVRFYYTDERNLEEINKISEYKVTPIIE